jgi:excisionase family DNA binding protein
MTDEPVKPDTLLEVREVARKLGLRESTIRRLILEKKIAVYRPSARAVRISEKTIQEILSKGYTPAVARRHSPSSYPCFTRCGRGDMAAMRPVSRAWRYNAVAKYLGRRERRVGSVFCRLHCGGDQRGTGADHRRSIF